jgi:hypothetical protein
MVARSSPSDVGEALLSLAKFITPTPRSTPHAVSPRPVTGDDVNANT